MNYKRIYKQLCDRGQVRVPEKGVFYEKHHIKPRSFGGNNSKENLTLLTLKEHYIAHLLLTYIYPESPAMYRALWNMCNVSPKNNKDYKRYTPSGNTYQKIRSEYMKICGGKNHPMYGRCMSEYTKNRLRESNIGIGRRLGAVLSTETKEKIGNSNKGKVRSKEVIERIKQSLKGGNCYKAKQIICTETGKIFASSRELSEYLSMNFNSVRNYLQGGCPCPDNFHYRRVEKDTRRFDRKKPFKAKISYDMQAHYKNSKESDGKDAL